MRVADGSHLVDAADCSCQAKQFHSLLIVLVFADLNLAAAATHFEIPPPSPCTYLVYPFLCVFSLQNSQVFFQGRTHNQVANGAKLSGMDHEACWPSHNNSQRLLAPWHLALGRSQKKRCYSCLNFISSTPRSPHTSNRLPQTIAGREKHGRKITRKACIFESPCRRRYATRRTCQMLFATTLLTRRRGRPFHRSVTEYVLISGKFWTDAMTRSADCVLCAIFFNPSLVSTVCTMPREEAQQTRISYRWCKTVKQVGVIAAPSIKEFLPRRHAEFHTVSSLSTNACHNMRKERSRNFKTILSVRPKRDGSKQQELSVFRKLFHLPAMLLSLLPPWSEPFSPSFPMPPPRCFPAHCRWRIVVQRAAVKFLVGSEEGFRARPANTSHRHSQRVDPGVYRLP